MMREPVQQCGCHFWIDEHAGPLRVTQISGNDDAGAFVELAEWMEEQRAAGS